MKYTLKFHMNFKIAELLFEMSKIFQRKHLLVLTKQYWDNSPENPISINRMPMYVIWDSTINSHFQIKPK